MSDKYPTKELSKILPQQWPEGFVVATEVDENNEDGVFVELGKANNLLPSGRFKPLIELFIEDRETNKEALDYIDREMEVDTSPFAAQMAAMGMSEEKKVVELEGEKYFKISRKESPISNTQNVKIFYVRDRFLVQLRGSSDTLTDQLAQKIVQSLNFSAELALPEKQQQRRSPTDALESVMAAAYAPMMKEAETIQAELEELEKLHAQGKITADEYQRRQIEFQAKAIAMSQKFMGVGVAQQMQTVQSLQSQFCPNCGDPAVNVKFCPKCGTKIPEKGLGGLARAASAFIPGARIGWGVGSATDVISERFTGASPAWHKEHETAFELAQNEAKGHFHRCPKCKKWVCETDWNEQEGLCVEDAPRVSVEVAAAKAQKMASDILAKAAGTQVFTGEIESKQTLCPQCGKPAGEGKFCNNCGASLTMIKCTKCGTQNPHGTRFCGECGMKLG